MFEETPPGGVMVGGKEGRIKCKECDIIIGRFKWQGAKCGCGEWVIPYIGVHEKVVDLIG